MGLGAGLGAPGSGFPSEESEESRILQPPQYFWEEEELNDSSLDLGPTAGSSSHLRVRCSLQLGVQLARQNARGPFPCSNHISRFSLPAFTVCCPPIYQSRVSGTPSVLLVLDALFSLSFAAV